MPWIAWPDDVGFSWGYNPAYFFSVESAYTTAAGDPLNRLSRLVDLIDACHEKKLHVILDIVLQHAISGSTTNGFPYYWLWQNPATECPFVGQFVDADDFGMLPLNYGNACTQQFVTDVCTYWMDRFNLDGFRFDQVTGYHNAAFPRAGAPALIAALTAHVAATDRENFSMILEDSWGFDAVDDSNVIRPTGTWFDEFRSGPFAIFSGYAVVNYVDTSYMRILNAAYQFNAPICPVNYIENHDHGSVTCRVGGRDRWYKTQPYLIALATCSGGVLVHNGQEWGQFEDIWEDDSNAPAADKRVQPRPLLWAEQADVLGQTIQSRYQQLLSLRDGYPGLSSPNFYPDTYDEQWTSFSPDGYGINEALQVAIYHRWGNDAAGNLERFIVVLNFSDSAQAVNIPFPANGTWVDLINGNAAVAVSSYWLNGYSVPSNWGCVFRQ
jgi:1,4-alpha-glucan branching enzyme